jgi:hypothetical protein
LVWRSPTPRYFKSAPKAEVTLQILDSRGSVVREFSSIDKKQPQTPPEWPDLVPPEEKIPVEAGMNQSSTVFCSSAVAPFFF